MGWTYDVNGATAVMLDDLVLGVIGAAADDIRVGPSDVVLDANGVLADVLEPHELQRASARAVDSLRLIGADDDVLQGGALVEVEDGVFPVCLIRGKEGFSLRISQEIGGREGVPPSLWPLQAPLPRSYFFHPPS